MLWCIDRAAGYLKSIDPADPKNTLEVFDRFEDSKPVAICRSTDSSLLVVLCENGNLFQVDRAGSTSRLSLSGSSYLSGGQEEAIAAEIFSSLEESPTVAVFTTVGRKVFLLHLVRWSDKAVVFTALLDEYQQENRDFFAFRCLSDCIGWGGGEGAAGCISRLAKQEDTWRLSPVFTTENSLPDRRFGIEPPVFDTCAGSDGDSLFFTGTKSGMVRKFSISDGKGKGRPVAELNTESNGPLRCLAVHHRGRIFAVANGKGAVWLVDYEGPMRVRSKLPFLMSGVSAMSFSGETDGELFHLYVATFDRMLHIFKGELKERKMKLVDHQFMKQPQSFLLDQPQIQVDALWDQLERK